MKIRFYIASCENEDHIVYIEEADLEDIIALLRKDVEHRRRRSRHFKQIHGNSRGDANAKQIKTRGSLADRLRKYLNE